MKKTLIVLLISMFAFVGKAYSEMSYGVSLAVTEINASGSEVEGGETTSADVDNTVAIPSIFVEYAYSDQISIGLDYIPLSADVSKNTKTRKDTETSVSGTADGTSTARTNKAQAEIENHTTLYVNYGLTDSIYLKGGVAFVTFNTLESLGTGSKYGNEDVYGGVIGLGAKSDNHRFELVYTDYEDISLTSSTARAGVSPNNKIDADLDTVAFKYSYAF